MDVRWIFGAGVSALLLAAVGYAQPLAETAALARPPIGLAPVPAPLLANLPLPSNGPDVISPAATAAVRLSIEQANAAWLAALRSGDSEGLAEIYAVDANLFPPDSVSLEGPQRIAEYFAAQRREGMRDASLKTLDVVCVGDIAYEVGVYGVRYGSDEGGVDELPRDEGRYFAIWKAQADGTWRYQVGIWSSNRETASAR